jgi:ankyrin repeat protein
MRVLVEAGADVEAQGAGGARPLYIVAQGEHGEVVRALVEAGADAEA